MSDETRRDWRALLRPVYHRAYRRQLRLRCWIADCFGQAQIAGAPLPPALLRYRVSESLSTTDFLNIGKACAQHIETQLNGSRTSLAEMTRVLDFGCGCGRTLRWLMEGFPSTQFFGVDVDREAIEWCRQHLSKGIYATSHREPPLRFASRYFDLVYCVSVFTHLDEPLQDAWLAEIGRVLKASGILVLTIHGERAQHSIRGDELARKLRETGFAHQRSQKLAGIVPDWYNTSWHSAPYIVKKLSALFGNVNYVVIPDGSQDLVIAQAPRQ